MIRLVNFDFFLLSAMSSVSSMSSQKSTVITLRIQTVMLICLHHGYVTFRIFFCFRCCYDSSSCQNEEAKYRRKNDRVFKLH
jgi:hypothetical protein